MSTDAIDAVVATLAEKIQAKYKDIAELKRAANTICRDAGKEIPFTEETEPEITVGGRVRPDEFYGKGVATAARLYLEKRKQAASGEEILKALQDGGFDFQGLGWKGNLLRPLAMSLSKNTAQFHRLPNGMFGLTGWYTEMLSKKKKATADEEESETAAE